MAVANEREDESEILPLIDGVGFPYIHFHDASSLFLSPLRSGGEKTLGFVNLAAGASYSLPCSGRRRRRRLSLLSLSLPSVSIIFSSSLFFFLLHPLAKRKEEEERRENLLDGPRGKERVKWAQAKNENRQLKKDFLLQNDSMFPESTGTGKWKQ